MLAFKKEGKGTPVVLLHAFPLSSRMWRSDIQALSPVAQVIAPDLPGFGGSAGESSASIAEMARAVAGLLDHLNVREPVFLAGLSMGGYVAFEFLRQFPKRLRGLALLSTRAVADTPETKEKRFKGIEAIQTLGLEAYGKKMLPNLLGETTRQNKPEVVSEVMEMILSNRPEGPMNALKAMAERRDSTDLLSSISFPVVVGAGEEDTLIKPEDARALHAGIPGAQLHVLPQCGHLFNLEQPKISWKILTDFVLENFPR